MESRARLYHAGKYRASSGVVSANSRSIRPTLRSASSFGIWLGVGGSAPTILYEPYSSEVPEDLPGAAGVGARRAAGSEATSSAPRAGAPPPRTAEPRRRSRPTAL